MDCASTADAMRMLTLPSTFGLYLERAWPRHRRLSALADDGPSAAVVDLLERVAAGIEELSTLLTDAERSARIWCSPPNAWSPPRPSARWARCP